MQHEPNTRTIIHYGREETHGPITEIRIGAGYRGSHPTGNWRRNPDLGGGTLYDMGVYPINAMRYSSGKEAVAVRGRQWSERLELYAFVDEFSGFEVEFPEELYSGLKLLYRLSYPRLGPSHFSTSFTGIPFREAYSST